MLDKILDLQKIYIELKKTLLEQMYYFNKNKYKDLVYYKKKYFKLKIMGLK
jgi:hypothetical protein